jgi:hypothetical protein
VPFSTSLAKLSQQATRKDVAVAIAEDKHFAA